MTDFNPTDHAAMIRAANQSIPEVPEWLSAGKHVYSPEYGVGEVMAVLGKRLIVKFVEEVKPTQFEDWQQAISRGLIKSINANLVSSTTFLEETNTTAATIIEQIRQIPQIAFQSVAQEVIANITTVDITNAKEHIVHPIPEDLPPTLRLGLHKNGISSIYSHQLEALIKLRAGFDLSLTTPTASGKTLCYNLAILESCIKQPQTTALYIFPLKALAFDQMRKLRSLFQAMPHNHLKIALMTGDTPKQQRQRFFIPSPPNILAVSPDLLHYYLYNVCRQHEGEGWRQFLKQLRWVVIDESHTYIGAFGAHFANLMRRLRLAVDAVGGNSQKLQFICSSATIGNPQQMALRFSGRTHQPQRLHLIENSGAPSAGRTLLTLTPNISANVESTKIVISWLQHNLSGIVFCNSRVAVKNLLGLIQRETQRLGIGHLVTKVALYYGSLKSDRRGEIIQKLQAGQIKVIISTSSLEAGIDLPELDCCLIRGFPGSLMSFWQRVGRAGRKQHGLVIYLPLAQNLIDVYYARHSQKLLSPKMEEAAFNPDYPTILGKHLECACIESSLPITELNTRFGKASGVVADVLLKQNKIYLSNNGRFWGRGYPHKEINLRSTSNSSISLINKQTDDVLENMSLFFAHREIFPGAIYMMQDESGELVAYRSESLNEEEGKAFLTFLGKDTGLFTEAETDLDIQPLSTLAESKIISTSIEGARLRLTLVWGEIKSSVIGYNMMRRTYGMTCRNQQCAKYKQPLEGKNCPLCKRPLSSAEVKTLHNEIVFPQPYMTKYQAPCVIVEFNQPLQTALQAEVNKCKQKIMSANGNEIPEQYQPLWNSSGEVIALHSMMHQIIKAVPLVVLSSSLDVDEVIIQTENRNIGYFLDTCEGGNGATEAIFSDFTKFAAASYALAAECDCKTGCPRCLHSSNCPQENEPLLKDVGLFLLNVISQAGQNP